MCRNKGNGGRRCGESSEPEYRAAYRARRKATLAEAAVAGTLDTIAQGHHATTPVPQAVTDAATYDARVAYYTGLHLPDTDARDWADLPIPTEVGAAWVEHDFTAAQTQEWLSARYGGQRGVQLEAALEWMAVGVTDPSEAIRWVAVGFEPEEARPWREAGISRADAVRWEDGGVEARDAPKWLSEAFHPASASLWASDYEPHEARDWADAGVIDGSTAKGWEQRDFTPDDARRWIAAGCDCAETAGSYVDELADIPREHTLSAYQCGYTVTEAAALDWEDPKVVAGLRTIGALKVGIASSPAA